MKYAYVLKISNSHFCAVGISDIFPVSETTIAGRPEERPDNTVLWLLIFNDYCEAKNRWDIATKDGASLDGLDDLGLHRISTICAGTGKVYG